jgi:hypothetical protein
MAKKPAKEESGEVSANDSEASTMGDSESGTGSQTGDAPTGSGSEVSEASGASSASDASDSSQDASEQTEETPKKKGISARTKKATGKQRAVPATGARAIPRRSGGGHDLVPVICSECYEELVFDSGVFSDVLTCPICEHQAARPDDAQLAIIAQNRSDEKKNFMIGLILCLVSVGAFGVWIWVLRNPHNNSQENNAAFYGPMVISLLTYIGCLAFTLSKYESARHDVYF